MVQNAFMLSFICLILEFNIKFLSHSFPSLDGKNKPIDTQNKIPTTKSLKTTAKNDQSNNITNK